jgi:hypothetical protein
MQLRALGQIAAATVFCASALLKLFDFAPSADLFASMLHISDAYSHVALAALILLELGSAYLLFAYRSSDVALGVVRSVCIVFLVVSVALWVGGESNCGCFGAWITITPTETVLKNVLLTAFVIVPARKANART